MCHITAAISRTQVNIVTAFKQPYPAPLLIRIPVTNVYMELLFLYSKIIFVIEQPSLGQSNLSIYFGHTRTDLMSLSHSPLSAMTAGSSCLKRLVSYSSWFTNVLNCSRCI